MKLAWNSIKYVWQMVIWAQMTYLWKKIRPQTVIEIFKQEEAAAAHACRNARNSRLGWVFDLEPRLHKMGAPLVGQTGHSEHRYHIIKHDDSKFNFQISAYTNRLYPPRPDESGKLTTVVEDPASLVFSCHPNGTVIVIAYPHASKWGTFGRDKNYIIASYNSTNDLAGAAGDAMICKHIKLFLKLTSLSLASVVPNKSSARLLEKLELETNRYSRIYESKNEQRRAIVESELALGAGLAAGLVASTLFPMAQSIGKEAADSARSIAEHCSSPIVSNVSLCLSGNGYHMKSLISSVLATENLAISAGVITTFVVGIMWRRLKSR